MIVVLRRIRHAAGRVSGTEWMLVAVEGLLVFLGIVAAFQLEQWAGERSESRHVDRLVDRLVDEAQLNIVDLHDLVKSFADRLTRAERSARQLGAGECPPQEGFAASRFMGFYPTIAPPRAVYDEMVAGVGLSAIEDYDVRLSVTRYRNSLDFLQGQVDYFRDGASFLDDGDPRKLVTYRGLLANTTSLDDRQDAIEIVYDRDALCADASFRNRLAHATRNQVRMQQYRRQALHDAAYMCVRLARMQGRQCFDPVLRSLIGEQDADNLERTAAIIEREIDNF